MQEGQGLLSGAEADDTRKERVMKKLFAVLLLGLIVVALPVACNSADPIPCPFLSGAT